MIRIKKKLLSLLTAGFISISHLPHAIADMHVEGDKIKTTKSVNMRLNNGFDGKIIDTLKQDVIVSRILSCDNGWSLVSYDHKIGFVKDEYIEEYQEENIYCDLDFAETRKILLTRNITTIHLNPFQEADVISTINANIKVEVLAYSSNGWYLVNYQNKLGFVDEKNLIDMNIQYCGKDVVANHEVNIRSRASTNSEKYNILYKGETMPYIREEKDFYVIDYYGKEAYVSKKYADVRDKLYTPIDFMKLICLNNDTFLFGSADFSKVIGNVYKYETGEVLAEEGDFYLIRTSDNQGYVYKKCTSTIQGMVVIVDLSDQKLFLYQDNHLLMETNAVTGSDKTPTNCGKYKVQIEQQGRILTGENYKTYVNYWIQYDGDYGIHDYSKQKGNFGGNIYHKNGSHGCIRLHIIPMEKLYQYVKTETPVIIHK